MKGTNMNTGNKTNAIKLLKNHLRIQRVPEIVEGKCVEGGTGGWKLEKPGEEIK